MTERSDEHHEIRHQLRKDSDDHTMWYGTRKSRVRYYVEHLSNDSKRSLLFPLLDLGIFDPKDIDMMLAYNKGITIRQIGELHDLSPAGVTGRIDKVVRKLNHHLVSSQLERAKRHNESLASMVKDKSLSVSLSSFTVTKRLANTFLANEWVTAYDVYADEYSNRLGKLPNFGKKSFIELIEIFTEAGLPTGPLNF